MLERRPLEGVSKTEQYYVSHVFGHINDATYSPILGVAVTKVVASRSTMD